MPISSNATNIILWNGGAGAGVEPGPSSGSGLLLEDEAAFLLLEDGSFLLLEG